QAGRQRDPAGAPDRLPALSSRVAVDGLAPAALPKLPDRRALGTLRVRRPRAGGPRAVSDVARSPYVHGRPGPPPLTAEPSVAYVTLDPCLRRRDPVRFGQLFDGFVTGYVKHFSGDQAETRSEWSARIEGTKKTQPVMRIVVAVDSVDSQERVVGGVAAEYYRAAECVLATYLYVEHPYRRHRHARSLLEEAWRTCALIGLVRAVFSEAEWPEALESLNALAPEIATARGRLRFFARLRARLIAIDYVQPALDRSKQPVVSLRLFVLPLGADAPVGTDEAVAATAGTFLDAFYAALAEGSGALEVSALETMKRQLRERRPLTMPLPVCSWRTLR